jgi:hypothetical protein
MFVHVFGAELPFLASVVNMSDSNVKWSDPFPRCHRSSHMLSILFLCYCFRIWRGGVTLGAGGGRVASGFFSWSDVLGVVTIIDFGAVGFDMSILPTIVTGQGHGIAVFRQL